MKELIKFEWDTGKAQSNELKHGITFDEAKTVFYDPFGKIIADPDHSENEERYVLMGISTGLNILVVCHCYRHQDKTIRIISARMANKREAKTYREGTV